MENLIRTQTILHSIIANGVVVTLFLIPTYLSILSRPLNVHEHFTYFDIAEMDEYLLDNKGCFIPNYSHRRDFQDTLSNTSSSCGKRLVFVRLAGENKIQFKISDGFKMYRREVFCCYQFSSFDSADTTYPYLIHSHCKLFKNGSVENLLSHAVSVSCHYMDKRDRKVVVYTDSYLIFKRNPRNNEPKPNDNKTHWNVLMIGMDTMSRARTYEHLKKTIVYLKRNKWLDYWGYQRTKTDTFLNLMNLLYGREVDDPYCFHCNAHMMWTRYKRAGYTTVYAEDKAETMFTPQFGFPHQLTDYDTKPFFLLREKYHGDVHCSGKHRSGAQLLNYATAFVNSYRKEQFFAFFWLNSVGPNRKFVPSLLDSDLHSFLSSLRAYDNTFVFLFSDYGLQFGDFRRSIQSFYDEKLPMMFVHVPEKFRTLHQKEYSDMLENQNRLISPSDIYLTLGSILKYSNKSARVYPSIGCPQCTSLFERKSWTRTCSDANIDPRWCVCRNMYSTFYTSADDSKGCVDVAVAYVKKKVKTIKTRPCTFCKPLELNQVLRTHIDIHSKKQKDFYVVAFSMSPGDMAYEASVQTDGKRYELLQPLVTLTTNDPVNDCTVDTKDRDYCICGIRNNCPYFMHK